MLRMQARRNWFVQAAAGTDAIGFGITLPSDTVVHRVNVKGSFVGATEAATAFNAFGVAFECWLLPLLDPDAGLTYEAIWDNLVPKDTDVEVLDLDTAAADTNPFWEPGELDMGRIMDVGLRPRKLFHEHAYITIANGAVIVWQDNQTPFVLKYWPGGTMGFSLRRGFRVKQPSVLVCAIASPNINDTTATPPTVLSEAQIPQTKYMGDVLKRALMHQLGVVEAGAETPWEEASAVLRKHLVPDVFEGLADAFAGASWNWSGEAMIDHSVTGTLGVKSIDGGR